jgi:hypothetical protein
MDEYRVVIPNESYSILQFNKNNLPGIAVVNTALRGFEPKVVFAWHLSIILEFRQLIERGMPSQDEQDVVDTWGDELGAAIKGADIEKPNSLFLARITWNATRELIWRVYQPESVNDYLQQIIKSETFPRQFDYRMDHDPEWKMTEWHLAEHPSEQ